MEIKIVCWVIVVGAFCLVYYHIFKKMTKGVIYSESLTGLAPAFIGMILGGIVSTGLYWIFKWAGFI